MPFTALLGTANSRPGNIVLGLGGVSNALNPTVIQSLNLSHQVQVSITRNLSVSQTLTFTQVAVKTLPETVNHTLTLTQTTSVEKFKAAGVVQALVLTQTASVLNTIKRTVNQGLTLTHQGRYNIYRVKSVSQALALTHSAVGVASKSAKNTLTLTHEATYVLARHVKHQLSIGQLVLENHTSNRRLFSNLIPFQVIQFNGTYRRALSHTVTLTQTVTVQTVRPAKNQLVLTQEALVDKVKPGFSELALTQDVVLSYTKNMAALSRLFLTQLVGLQKSRGASVASVLGLEHRARGTRVLTRSVTQSLVLTQEVVRDRHTESVNQTLTLTQTCVGRKIAPRSVSQALVLTQSVQVSTTINRHVQHQLVFGNSFLRYVGLPGLPYVDVPGLQVVLVRRQTVLEHGSSVIVLPSAEFDDREGGLGKINIKRAMDGTRRVYKRDQPSSRLVYEFVIDRLKAIELRQFLLTNNSNVIRMTNWKGEIWMVVLTNNPFQFTEDSYREGPWGNRSSITLEFQGVRVN